MADRPSVSERRFREGNGERFLVDGVTVRCQAVSKLHLRRLRDKTGDYESPSDAFWPAAQCKMGAVEGTYLCRYHGGKSPQIKPRSFLESLPIDLAEHFEAMQNDPSYLNRREDIVLLKARRAQLLARLSEEAGTEEAWAGVVAAYKSLREGDDVEALMILRSALEAHHEDQSVWSEIYQLENRLESLTTTQVKTGKELSLMATTEQVTSLMAGIQEAFLRVVDRFIADEREADKIKSAFVGELRRLTNTGNFSTVGGHYQLPEPDQAETLGLD